MVTCDQSKYNQRHKALQQDAAECFWVTARQDNTSLLWKYLMQKPAGQ